jgi:hypothetical protein
MPQNRFALTSLMKRALVLINTTDSGVLNLYKLCLQQHSEYQPFFVTLNPSVPAALQSAGIDCAHVGVHREKIPAVNMEKACALLEREPYSELCVPGTDLEIWKIIFWDRFYQFMDVVKADAQQALFDLLDYHLLIAPFDIHDLVAQRLARSASARGIPTVGIRSGYLRTKEQLDALPLFDRFFVHSRWDAEFLFARKGIEASRVSLIPNTPSAAAYLQFSNQARLRRTAILEKAGFVASKRILFVSFALRHIWELRQLLKILPLSMEACPGGTGGFQVAVYPEGAAEAAEFSVLFQKELAELHCVLLSPGSQLLELLAVTEHCFYFRVADIVSLASSLGTKVTIYDPFFLNCSDQLLCGESGIVLHSEKSKPFHLL